MRTERLLVAAALLVTAAFVGACDGDGDGDGDDGGTGPVVSFGQGSVPDQFPEDFPLPPGAVIGSTLVDGRNVKTEMELRVRQDIADVAQFFTVNLVSSGFVIDSSSQEGTRWTMDFRRDRLTGSLVITSPTTGVSQAVVTLNTA